MDAPERKMENNQVCLALVHHANQYVITNGYTDRQGMNEILGLGNPVWEREAHRKGFLPLLQMHLDYRIPLNLHMSGTLMETLVWHYPGCFALIKRLKREGLLELIGSTFSQNVMPFFSSEYNLRQVNEELWMYQQHLGWDLEGVKTFWVPERVWDTEKLAKVLTSKALLNGGYKRVLLDDRLVYSGGQNYEGSPRQRFDSTRPLDRDSFGAWEIVDGEGLVMLPMSRDLRFNIPPSNVDSWRRVHDTLRWVADNGGTNAIAIYGDDLERAAGVGGWNSAHSQHYEQFLKWLADTNSIKPVLIGDWASGHSTVGTRAIEQGTFYELAQEWRAGEDYRGWYEDPACQEHRHFLTVAEQALISAEECGAEQSLLDLGWRHLLHSSYETSWHNRAEETPGQFTTQENARSMWLAPWAAALTSHARSCLVIATAAKWYVERDGLAHAEMADVDGDGEEELIVKNDSLFAVFSPKRGGRLIYLFDLSGEEGRLMIGNISDDWNLQEELNRYMDCPRNHPGALSDVGYEHNCYQTIIPKARGLSVQVSLRNVESGSLIHGMEKRISMSADSRHLDVTYTMPEELWRLSTEVCLSPDYFKLLKYGKKGLMVFNGPDWKGWSNGLSRVWVRVDQRQSTIWDKPYQDECGHGLNLRITSFSRQFTLELGVGTPPLHAYSTDVKERAQSTIPMASVAPIPAQRPLIANATILIRTNGSNGKHAANGNGHALNGKEDHREEPGRDEDNISHILRVTNPHFMRRFLNNALPAMRMHWFKASACRVRILRPHHNKLTLEYNLQCGKDKKQDCFTLDLVGTWRQDDRNSEMYDLMNGLWQAGFCKPHHLTIAQPLGHWPRLHLRLRERATGKLLKDWIYYQDADWVGPMRRTGAWLAKLHNTSLKVSRQFNADNEVKALTGWLDDMMACESPWITHEKERIAELMGELIARTRDITMTEVCLTHGDFHPENIFLRGNTITVIDFEQAMMGDPAFDLGYLIGEIDIQADRHWARRGRHSPLAMDRIAGALCEEYFSQRPSMALETVPLYCARTYLKHLMHTVRMKGSEDPKSVTLWLDKAAAYLKELRLPLLHPVQAQKVARASRG